MTTMPERQMGRSASLRLEELEGRWLPSTLISVTDRHDFVYDSSRGELYITEDNGNLQRFSVSSQQLLGAVSVGVSLRGADITPDGSALYVTDTAPGATQGFLHKVNLSTLAVTNLTYNLAFSEGGSYDVAIGSNGIGIMTTQFKGSGWVPLRQLDLTNDTLSIRTDDPGSGGNGEVRHNSLLRRGNDRSLLWLTESDISNGPMFTYGSASNTFGAGATTNLFLDNLPAAVNRNGTLTALEVNGAIAIMDAKFNAIINLGGLDGGMVFDPVQDVLYAVSSSADKIYAYDTNTWTVKYSLPIGEATTSYSAFGNGMMVVSSDDSRLFLSTPSGVREYTLPSATGVASSLTLSGFPTFISGGVTGSFTLTARDPAGNTATGYTGTVGFSSSDGSAALPAPYTFTSADHGVHTFSATLNAAGVQNLTATDTANNLSASATGITVHTQPANLIPVVSAERDLVYDPTRGFLYITTAEGTVQSYDVATQTLLAPITAGVSLRGADITPDGSALYVMDSQRSAIQGLYHKVNLSDGTVTNLSYPFNGIFSAEGGSWDVAAAADGKALADGMFEGSGWVPVRQIVLATDAISIRTDAPGSGPAGEVRQNTLIWRSADRSLLFFTESNISSGPIFTYNGVNDTFGKAADTNGFLDHIVSAVSRNGKLIAMDLKFNGYAAIMDNNFNAITNLPGIDSGVAFDPVRDILYGVNSSTGQIVAYDTNTWAVKFTLSIGETLSGGAEPFGTGMMTLSSDGHWLFLATPSGIRSYNVAENLVVSGFPSPVTAGTSGSVTVKVEYPTGQVDASYTGTVHFSTAGQATFPADYTFTTGDAGVHTFSGVVLKTTGNQSIIVTDTVAASDTGSQPVTVTPAAASHFKLKAVKSTTVGTSFKVVVTALDPFGNVATGYLGTIHFTSSDTAATLPKDFTFTASSAGRHAFHVTLNTAGTQTITVTDTVTPSIKGTKKITVNAALMASVFDRPLTWAVIDDYFSQDWPYGGRRRPS
jgi:sugar lactone lactonase YvrE